MSRFVLEGPRPCKIFFCAHTLCMNHVTKTFLLVSYSVSSIQQLCFVHGQGVKREQKHTTKNFDEFHNNPLLLTMPRLRMLELTRQTLGCKSSSLSCGTFKGCSMHKSVALEVFQIHSSCAGVKRLSGPISYAFCTFKPPDLKLKNLETGSQTLCALWSGLTLES